MPESSSTILLLTITTPSASNPYEKPFNYFKDKLGGGGVEKFLVKAIHFI